MRAARHRARAARRGWLAGLRALPGRAAAWPCHLHLLAARGARGARAWWRGLSLLTIVKAVTAACVLLTALAFAFGDFQRSTAVAGRTEVLEVRTVGAALTGWVFPEAVLRPGDGGETPPASGRWTLELLPGATARFLRLGRADAAAVVFERAAEAAAARPLGPGQGDAAARDPCEAGARGRLVGTARLGIGEPRPLCDVDELLVPLVYGRPPLTIAFEGAVRVGQSVRAGGERQPLLLEGRVTISLRPEGWPARWLCALPGLGNGCERYEVAGEALPLGAEAEWASPPGAGRRDGGAPAAVGFLRLDPWEAAPGFRFDVAADARALRVTRLNGEPIVVEESVFDRILRSPLGQTLVTLFTALGALLALFGGSGGGARAETERRGAAGRGKASAAALALLPLAAAAAAPGAASAQQVYVHAFEEGQGFLVARANRCQMVTLEHVAGRGEDRSPIATLVGPSRVQGEGGFLRAIPSAPEPLAVFDARGALERDCPAFAPAAPLDALLRGAPEGQLRVVRRDGGFANVPLVVQAVDFDVFLVRFTGSQVAARGMSGGTVLVGGQAAGLLVDVDAQTGLGRVMRMDRALERLRPWFLAADAAGARPAPPAAQPASAGLAFRVARWSAPPARPAEGASGLAEGRVWRVASDRIADVVLDLGVTATLSSVAFRVDGLDDPPREVEVLTSPAGAERWVSAGSVALERGDEERALDFAPRRAGMVMLRLHRAQPGQATMALRGVDLR